MMMMMIRCRPLITGQCHSRQGSFSSGSAKGVSTSQVYRSNR